MNPLLMLALGFGALKMFGGSSTSSGGPPVSLPPPVGPPPEPPAQGSATDAASLAPQVAASVRSLGMSYDRPLVTQFQKAAGLWADGMYGPATAGAVQYFTHATPPSPLYNFRGITPYTPNG